VEIENTVSIVILRKITIIVLTIIQKTINLKNRAEDRHSKQISRKIYKILDHKVQSYLVLENFLLKQEGILGKPSFPFSIQS